MFDDQSSHFSGEDKTNINPSAQKLDASMLIDAHKSCNEQEADMMILRRRQLVNRSIIKTNTYETNPSVDQEKKNLSRKSLCCNNISPLKEGSKDRTFSITTSVVLLCAILILISIVCLCLCNKSSTLLVDAHYSILTAATTETSSDKQYNGRPQIHNPHQATMKPSLSPRGIHQQAIDYENEKANNQNSHVVNYEKRSKYSNSIDRFDSGEQIRPPLLKQPTTLAPLAVSAPKNQKESLQTAATQDSYLSPEDREQFLKSQESHYEGRGNADAPESYATSNPNGYEQHGHHGAGINWNSANEQVNDVGVNANMNRNRFVRPDPSASSNVAAAPNDSDDGDYDEDNPELEDKKHKESMVPENRRLATNGLAASYNHQQQLRQQFRNRAPVEPQSNVDESNDSNEDYGSANDEVHFSRKQQNNNINPSASHNRQQKNIEAPMSARYNQMDSANHIGAGRDMQTNNLQGDENGQGFGPGPNEAYLADRAEMNGNNQDDEGSSMEPRDEDSGMDSNRRSMNYDNRLKNAESSQMPAKQPINYEDQHQARINNGNNDADNNLADPDNDSDDSSTDNEPENGSSYAPSYKTEVKQSIQNVKLAPKASPANNQASNQRTSASAPSPQSTPLNSPLKYSLPISVTKSHQAQATNPNLLDMTNNKLKANSQQQQQVKPTNLVSNNVPYNPQNNPSHAGKYFID